MLALLCSARATLCSRRKRGEKGEVVETIEDVIVRRLTAERIEELKKLLRDTQEQYRCVHVLEREPTLHILGIGRFHIQPHCVCVSFHDRKLKKEVDLIQTGHMDAQLKDLWADVTQYDTFYIYTNQVDVFITNSHIHLLSIP